MSAVTDSGDTAPNAQPAGDQPWIPPRPPAPVPPSATPAAQPAGGQGYPIPPEYATLPYPAQYRPADPARQPQAPSPHQYAPPLGYAPPPQGYGPYVPLTAAPRARRGARLGIVAFLLALVAAVGATVLGSIAAYGIGIGTGRSIALQPMDVDFDWSILTPVRDWVLLGEIAFWAGTVVGTWALVQGIVAIVKDRGRGWGVAAVILAVIGPIAFAVGVQALLAAGFASGASAGG
jgi:hypothetical protein